MKKQIIATLLVCGISLTAVSAPMSVLADEFDGKIAQQNKKIEDLNNKAATAQANLDKVQANIEKIRLDAQKLEKEQIQLGQQIEQLGTDIDALKVRIERRDATIKEQARSVQMEGKNSGMVDLLLSADSVSDAITKVAAATKLVNANNDLMKQQELDKKEVEAKKAETEDKMKELEANAVVLENKKADLEDQELQQTVLINELAAETATEESKKAEFIQQKEEAERQRAEQERLAKEAAERAAQEEAARAAAVAAAAQQRSMETSSAASAASESSTSSESTSTSTSNSTSNSISDVTYDNNQDESYVSSNTNNVNSDSSTISVDTGSNQVVNTPVAPPQVTPPANGGGIVASAYSYLGVPYVWGGSTPAGFDCSGLTQYVFAENGISLPRVTTSQEYSGTMISLSQLEPGDLVFFGSRGATHHVGIYVGGGNYIHAPQTGDVVKVTSISAYTPSFGVRVN